MNYIVVATWQNNTKVYLFETAEQAHDWTAALNKLLWSTKVYLGTTNYNFGYSLPIESSEVDVSNPDMVTTKLD